MGTVFLDRVFITKCSHIGRSHSFHLHAALSVVVIFIFFFLRNNMASAHLLELQGNLLFSHSSETAEGMQLSRVQLKRNYCGRGCALHISSKLEAKRRH